MKLKQFAVSVACIVCSMVFFPVVVVGGGMALMLLAAGSELSHLLNGNAGKGIDPSAAHEMAMRICFGYAARSHAS